MSCVVVTAAVSQIVAPTSGLPGNGFPGCKEDLTVALSPQERKIKTENAEFSFVGLEGL
jgi:hypothetical protein